MSEKHSYVACIRETTRNLPDIDSVQPFNTNDEACLDEVRQVLAKHNSASRFSVNLLHSHFDMTDEEVLIEETDTLSRTQTISVVKRSEVPEGAIYMDRRFDLPDHHPACDLYERMRGYRNDLLIKKLRADMKLSVDEATELFEDVKRFIALCATTPESLGLSRQIDQAWHTFILITRDYIKFCTDHCDRYIHHEPSDPFAPDAKDYRAEREKARMLALSVFGSVSKNWDVDSAQCTHNCTNGD